ncbi:hypothetical protein DP184_06525 [Enterobacter kobei]|nr:hypothetical protein DP184_06525 [Enterobacter kobei]RAY40358.1 hypothetical protein DP177_06555 [Enterobacter kobei]
MDKCQGIFGKLFWHSYRPAITKGAANLKLNAIEGSSSAIGELIDKTRPETFHGIYCKRCGKVING